MARPIEDITGRKVGRLTVLRFACKRNGKPYWVCRCACGVEKTVMGQSLRQQSVKSCGCLQYAERSGKVKTGRRFGRLTVVARAAKKNFWLCRCDCGNECSVKNTALTSEHTQSCGCFWLEQVTAAATIHGQAYTPEYTAMKARERLERKRCLDVEWTVAMDVALRELQTACVICESTDRLSVDHVLPLSKGYGLRPGNAVILCGSCNSSKFNKSLDDIPAAKSQRILEAAAQFKTAWENKE